MRTVRSATGISTDVVASILRKFLPSELRDSGTLELAVKDIDIKHYQAVHEELERRIRDAGLQDVWFWNTSPVYDPEDGGPERTFDSEAKG